MKIHHHFLASFLGSQIRSGTKPQHEFYGKKQNFANNKEANIPSSCGSPGLALANEGFMRNPLLGGSSHDLDTCLITMVIISPLTGMVPLPNGRTLCLINGGVTNNLLTGMILQVLSFRNHPHKPLWHLAS